MKYKFPTITNISQVLPAIEGSPEFVVAEREGYTVVNYNVSMPDTFPPIKVSGGSAKMRAEREMHNMIRRECRGIIFDSVTGNILSRRLHKFFNVGEKEEVQFDNLPWDKPYIIMDKLDGSMITPLYLDGKVRWTTKMGCTEVAIPVERFVEQVCDPMADGMSYLYERLANCCYMGNCTPIFEWTSNKQRIVIDHPEDKLVLLHIRENETGEYWDREAVEHYAMRFGVPVVRTWNSEDYTPKELLEVIRTLEGAEGVVVQFHDGHMGKIKSDWYVQIHKAKEAILWDRNIVEMILNNTIDDVKGHLLIEERNRLNDFEIEVVKAIQNVTTDIFLAISDLRARNMDRKNFALNESHKFDPLTKAAIFSMFDGCTFEEAYNQVIQTVRNKLSSNKSYAILTDDWLKGVEYNV